MIRMKAQSPGVYVTDEPVVHLSPSEMDFLASKIQETPRKRVRLCSHKNADDKLQEMFVAYAKETYSRPRRHRNKVQSLHVLDGEADFVFMDPAGKILKVVPLGPAGSGREFYCRVPESVFHTFLVKTDRFIVHETIDGPFRPETAEFATWSPEEGDAAGIAKFKSDLTSAIRAFRE